MLVDLRGLASQGWLPADFQEDYSVDGEPGPPRVTAGSTSRVSSVSACVR